MDSRKVVVSKGQSIKHAKTRKARRRTKTELPEFPAGCGFPQDRPFIRAKALSTRRREDAKKNKDRAARVPGGLWIPARSSFHKGQSIKHAKTRKKQRQSCPSSRRAVDSRQDRPFIRAKALSTRRREGTKKNKTKQPSSRRAVDSRKIVVSKGQSIKHAKTRRREEKQKQSGNRQQHCHPPWSCRREPRVPTSILTLHANTLRLFAFALLRVFASSRAQYLSRRNRQCFTLREDDKRELPPVLLFFAFFYVKKRVFACSISFPS